MTAVDYWVLIGYFVFMAAIGLACMLKIRHQEDFFLGGRSFGKVLQAFAAFGAGTGANDPVTLGRTTYTSGLSGIWSVLLWLFVTPFYWITGVWYRRMRHLTLGDWFVERYESRGLGVAYSIFAIYFYMIYLSVGFSAVGKVCAPLIGADVFNIPWLSDSPVPIEYVLVPIISLVVVVYGVLGGLRAAYWTDFVQGVFIILLSIILIPFGLEALVDRYGGTDSGSLLEGFRVLHERVSPDNFEIIESPRGGEFPLYYIVAITLINLVGIVVQPHFIATGGGSARTETSARVGLVTGNLLKRFCTVGWALTALIVLALLADNVEIAGDPDRVWGVAAREILGPLGIGLVGLMLACLLAALMSSADCYMLVTSALVVRNCYAAYVKRDASEREYVRVGRIVSLLIIAGAAFLSMTQWNVFDQLRVTWELPVVFAAAFWIGMYWRRATRWAAWLTVGVSALLFFILPILLPALLPGLRLNREFAVTNDITTTIVTRRAAPADVARRQAAIRIWEEGQRDAEAEADPEKRAALLATLAERPAAIEVGQEFRDVFTTGGKPIFWRGTVQPVVTCPECEGKMLAPADHRCTHCGAAVADVKLTRVVVSEEPGEDANTLVIRERYAGEIGGTGYFNLDFLFYRLLGIDLTGRSNPMLETLRLPPKIITPFVIMILISLFTPRVTSRVLDRYYVKMKTPVDPDPGVDRRELETSYESPHRFDHRRLFPGTQLEFQRPTVLDVAGFVLSFVACFLIIALILWIAGIGA